MSTITATQEGRNLCITFPGIDKPYIVEPLPARAGLQITQTYLRLFTGPEVTAQEMHDVVTMVVDGAEPDGESWKPRAAHPVLDRLESELSAGEVHEVVMPALFWQTIASWRAVAAFIEAGGGSAGDLAAASVLIGHMRSAAGVAVVRTSAPAGTGGDKPSKKAKSSKKAR